MALPTKDPPTLNCSGIRGFQVTLVGSAKLLGCSRVSGVPPLMLDDCGSPNLPHLRVCQNLPSLPNLRKPGGKSVSLRVFREGQAFPNLPSLWKLGKMSKSGGPLQSAWARCGAPIGRDIGSRVLGEESCLWERVCGAPPRKSPSNSQQLSSSWALGHSGRKRAMPSRQFIIVGSLGHPPPTDPAILRTSDAHLASPHRPSNC